MDRVSPDRFGRRARELREDEGISLRRAAARAQVDPAHLMRIERGDAVPTLRVAQQIANAVDSRVGELVNEEETR